MKLSAPLGTLGVFTHRTQQIHLPVGHPDFNSEASTLAGEIFNAGYTGLVNPKTLDTLKLPHDGNNLPWSEFLVNQKLCPNDSKEVDSDCSTTSLPAGTLIYVHKPIDNTASMAQDYATVLLKHMEGMGMDNVYMTLSCGRFCGSSQTGIYENVEVVELGDTKSQATEENMRCCLEVFKALAAGDTQKLYTTVKKASPYITTHILWQKPWW